MSGHRKYILAAALFLSLSANAFLAGLWLGDRQEKTETAARGEMRGAEDCLRGHAAFRARERQIADRLSPEDRGILEADRAQRRAEFEEMKQAVSQARDAVRAAMTADPFDPAQLAEAVQAEVGAKTALMQRMREARRTVLERLSPAGRALMRDEGAVRRPPPPEEGHGHLPPP